MAIETLSFTVPGDPLPKGSTTAFVTPDGVPHVTSSQRGLKGWEQRVALAANFAAQGKRFYGAVHLSARFHLTRPASLPKRTIDHLKAPDLDKLARAVGDALAGVLYDNDSQIVDWSLRKYYATELPHVEIIVTGETSQKARKPRAVQLPFEDDHDHTEAHETSLSVGSGNPTAE